MTTTPKETAKDTMLLLMEELGELARAIRKHEGMSRDHEYDVELSEELADVQLYLVHLANQTGIDLGVAVTAKEEKNEARFNKRQG
ncbi:MAG: MazG protein [Candidatus Saccharibacteria bacterium]|nr:MazG protein [Candidatus Saccharibacteria bacterium]